MLLDIYYTPILRVNFFKLVNATLVLGSKGFQLAANLFVIDHSSY